MFSSLSRIVKFKNIWNKGSVCFGMVSKRKKLVNKIKIHDARLRGPRATERLGSQGPTKACNFNEGSILLRSA